MLLDVCDQPFLVLAHSEEIIRLAELLDRPLALGTQAADDIFLSPEPFVEGAVPARIGPLVNLACVIQLLQRLLHDLRMARLRRADKVVVRDVQPFPQVHELRSQPVTMRLRRNPGPGRRLFNLLARFVAKRFNSLRQSVLSSRLGSPPTLMMARSRNHPASQPRAASACSDLATASAAPNSAPTLCREFRLTSSRKAARSALRASTSASSARPSRPPDTIARNR